MYMKGCLWWRKGGWRLRGGTEWSALVHFLVGGVSDEASSEGGKASGLLADLGKTGGWIWIWVEDFDMDMDLDLDTEVILVCGSGCWSLLLEPCLSRYRVWFFFFFFGLTAAAAVVVGWRVEPVVHGFVDGFSAFLFFAAALGLFLCNSHLQIIRVILYSLP